MTMAHEVSRVQESVRLERHWDVVQPLDFEPSVHAQGLVLEVSQTPWLLLLVVEQDLPLCESSTQPL